MATKKTPTPTKVSAQSPAKPATQSKAVREDTPALTIDSAVSKAPRSTKPSEAAKKPVAAKAITAKKAPLSKAVATKPTTEIKPDVQISLDDVALRAYFIAEKRRALGIPGDEHQDWINAEREIQAELQPKDKSRKS